MASFDGVSWEAVGTTIGIVVLAALSAIGKIRADKSPDKPTVSKVVPSTPVEMAALVDSSALNNATAAINALQLTLAKGQVNNKEIAEELVGALRDASKAFIAIRDELKDMNENMEESRRAIETLAKDIDRAADGIKLGMMFAAKGQ